jgi:hypothetical protein
MAGNKTDNGVHEIGSDDILASYQADTPGEIETSYLKDVNEFIDIAEKKKKEQEKTHFSMVFDNPLKGFPYNEQYGFDKTLEEGKMGEIYAAIQMGYTAKELDDDFNVGLSTAKTWIREYWAAKKANRGSMKKESYLGLTEKPVEREEIAEMTKSKLKIDTKILKDLKKLEKSEKGMNDKEVKWVHDFFKKGVDVVQDGEGEPKNISGPALKKFDPVWGKMDTMVRDSIYSIMKKHSDEAVTAVLSAYGA